MTRPAGAPIPAFLVAALTLVAALLGACTTPAISGTAPATGASHDPAPSGFPLIGAWTTTISRDDLLAGGITEEGLLVENSGVFTWVLETDGTWRQVQNSLDGSPLLTPVYSGYYTVEDDILVMVTEFPEQYRDDGLRYAFEVSGETVSFDLLNPPDPMLPVVVESHPWSRVQP